MPPTTWKNEGAMSACVLRVAGLMHFDNAVGRNSKLGQTVLEIIRANAARAHAWASNWEPKGLWDAVTIRPLGNI